MSHVTEGFESNEKREASLESSQPAPPRETIVGLSRSLDKYTALISQCQVVIKLENAQAVNYTAIVKKERKNNKKTTPSQYKKNPQCVLQNWKRNREENAMM